MPKSYETDLALADHELVVTITGELDLTARPALTDQVTDEAEKRGVGRIAIDLAQVTFCDSSGLGALLDIRQAADDDDIAMVLRNVPPQVARLLDLTDADGWLARE